MRVAAILSLVVAVTAEAPYHLPRPAPHAPSFQYPSPSPQPLPQQYPPLQHHHHHGHSQSSGYHYQQPSTGPTFIQQAPQPQYIQPQPAPQLQYSQPAPQLQYNQPRPQPQYIQPQAPLSIPSTSYGTPQLAPQPLPQPFRTQQDIFPQQQIQSSYVYHPIQYYQQQQLGIQQQQFGSQQQFSSQQQLGSQQLQLGGQQGYSYQQPQLRIAPQQQLPIQLQSQNLGSAALSSYQADTNLYSGAQGQTHREVFDSAVLDRLQNLIKENEHSSARSAGYLSLVSGVSLENAQPSIEISSFTHQSALPVDSGFGRAQSISQSTGTSAVAPSAPSQDYGLPSISASSASTGSSVSSSSQSSANFLPQSQPASSYGPPN